MVIRVDAVVREMTGEEEDGKRRKCDEVFPIDKTGGETRQHVDKNKNLTISQ
jgi:hypothetical protein